MTDSLQQDEGHTTESPDHAGVAFHPPVLLLGLIVLGFGARWLVPAEFLPGTWAVSAGPILVVSSLALFVWAILAMRSGGGSIPTGEPTDSIVIAGPYRLTRNPIYLGMMGLLLGIGVWANSLWFVAFVPIGIAFFNWGVISREERYLERKFGDAYLGYKRRVRRWC